MARKNAKKPPAPAAKKKPAKKPASKKPAKLAKPDESPVPGLGDMAAPKTPTAPRQGERQGELAGFGKPTDAVLDEIALPLMHAMDAGAMADKAIEEYRAQLLERMIERKVEKYSVHDGALECTFSRSANPRLGVKFKKQEQAEPEDANA